MRLRGNRTDAGLVEKAQQVLADSVTDQDLLSDPTLDPSSSAWRLKGSRTSHLSGRDSGLSDFVLDCVFERAP
jgi:hypothetical protein